jgi:hypothetical protein
MNQILLSTCLEQHVYILKRNNYLILSLAFAVGINMFLKAKVTQQLLTL